MLNMIRRIVIFVVIILVFKDKITIANENQVNDNDVLAILLGQKIMRSEFDRSEEKQNRFFYKIWDRLIDLYIKENKLTVSESDLLKCPIVRFIEEHNQSTKEEFEKIKSDTKRLLQIWKVDKSLFEKYGGKVATQQLYSYRPIGAYKKFLKEHKANGSFEILDLEFKKAFWGHFSNTEKLKELGPNEIDFSIPWFCKIPSKELWQNNAITDK